jgi:transposase
MRVMEMALHFYISKEQVEEIKVERKKNKNKNVEKRLKALLLYSEGKPREEIAKQTGYSVTQVSKLASKYLDHGISAVAGNNYKANRRNLSFEAEAELLDKFKKQAEQGQIVETSSIKKAYEEAIGRSLEKSHGQIYRVLERHGWRKVMPRSKHPDKASDEEIESSKKLTKR